MSLAVLGSGIVQGLAIALVAAGFTIIYNATKVVNFANGQIMVLGGYVGWFLYSSHQMPFPVAAAAAVGSGVALGVFSDRIVIGPLRNAGLLTQVIALLALTHVLDALYIQVFGAEAKNFPPYAQTLALVPGFNWSTMDLVIMATCIVVVGLLVLFLYETNLGTYMRATADNPIGASLVGINPRTVALAAWSIGGGLAALSGVLLIPKYLLAPNIGPNLTFDAFAAVVIGGFGSLTGAIAGALAIGVTEALVAGYFAAGYEPLVSLAVMLAVLTVRPTGLVGERA
jgi:branched-chain amino acid transport system permease protein